MDSEVRTINEARMTLQLIDPYRKSQLQENALLAALLGRRLKRSNDRLM